MTVKAATVERAIETLLNAIDGLTGAVLAKQRYPLDVGMQAQYETARAELRESIISLLMLIEVID